MKRTFPQPPKAVMPSPLLAIALLFTVWPAARAQVPPHQLDTSQARVVLRFLHTLQDHGDASALLDSVMAAPGTALVIAQQNVSRRVSAAEYRETLVALAHQRQPSLEYDPRDPRAAKGAEGLLHDVLPALRWGVAHVDLLESRLSAIAALDVEARARALAQANLPEPVPLDVPLLVVMGGRAGAAATNAGIYLDVLAFSYREPGRTRGPAEIVDYYAHELHHVGLGELLDREEKALRLDAPGARAFTLLRGLVMEGSASYLINGHRDLAAMRRDPAFATPGSDRDRMASIERVLAGVLEGGWSAADYDEASAKLAGNALHMTGAAMLDAIWRARGRTGVMEVMRDPRRLLLRYDQSVARTPRAYRFNTDLARRVSSLGA